MRGSPLIRALIVFAALLALSPFLWRVTQPADAANAPVPTAPTSVAAKPLKLELTLTAPAQRIAVLHLGREVWAKDMPALDEEAELALPWPKEGIELHFKIQRPENVRAAMRVKITGPDDAEQEQTAWSADEVLTFK
jgi:hypothetical protein